MTIEGDWTFWWDAAAHSAPLRILPNGQATLAGDDLRWKVRGGRHLVLDYEGDAGRPAAAFEIVELSSGELEGKAFRHFEPDPFSDEEPTVIEEAATLIRENQSAT